MNNPDIVKVFVRVWTDDGLIGQAERTIVNTSGDLWGLGKEIEKNAEIAAAQIVSNNPDMKITRLADVVGSPS